MDRTAIGKLNFEPDELLLFNFAATQDETTAATDVGDSRIFT